MATLPVVKSLLLGPLIEVYYTTIPHPLLLASYRTIVSILLYTLTVNVRAVGQSPPGRMEADVCEGAP